MHLSLHSIRLDSPLQPTGRCLVLAELIVPRNGIARRSAIKELQLSEGKRSLARAPFYERALLKEKVDGAYGLRVRVTRPFKRAETAGLFRQLLATGIESGSELIHSSLIRRSLLKDLFESGSDALVDRIEDNTAPFIAGGGIDLHSETQGPVNISIPLRLEDSIRSSAHSKFSERREKRKSGTKTYRKGSVVGELRFKLEDV